jgi:uncharacterized protein (TIGR03437 family)
LIILQIQPRGLAAIFPMTVAGVSGGRVLAVVPDAVPLGLAMVTMTVSNTSFYTDVMVSPASIGLFASSAAGFGPALAQNLSSGAPPSLNQLSNPALPEQYVTLWGTGLGSFTTADVSVSVYGIQVQPTFAGHAPGQSGVDQIDFRLPDNVPGGCYIPVTVTAGGRYSSNEVTIATTVTAGTACFHPLGLTADQLKRLDGGGTVPTGSLLTFSSARSLETGGFQRVESVLVSFIQTSAQGAFTGALRPGPMEPACGMGQTGTIVGTFSSTSGTYTVPIPTQVAPLNFGDAGATLTLAGPADRSLTLSGKFGSYAQVVNPPPLAPTLAALPQFFTGGAWTLSGPGGADVPAFQKTFTLPPLLAWTNRDILNVIDRNADLAITWNPQSHAASENVTVTIPTGSYSFISCNASVSSGSLVVPRDVLQSLPVGPSSLTVNISSDNGRPQVIDLPLKTGGTIPASIASYSSETLPVVIR